ncbi:MAG: 6,7-dimethyl-8-ribityllumazine synthase [Proteobacteria bacterium]|nr:6,7-dimethyl-8-ribityllumazine synthase [Pseudomonadota bacterium]
MKPDSEFDLSLWPTPELAAGKPGKRVNNNTGEFLLVRSLFHRDIADMLYESCRKTLLEHQVKDNQITVIDVPGSFELAAAIAGYLSKPKHIAAAVALGCIIQGETRHFDYVCSGTVNALSQINASGQVPIILGVLTTNTREEAVQRASPDKTNKGRDFALTALWMANLPHNSPASMAVAENAAAAKAAQSFSNAL